MRVSSSKMGMLVVALALVGAACGKSTPSASSASSGTSTSPSATAPSVSPSSSSSGGGTITIGSDEANNHGSKDVSGTSSLEVEMHDFYFSPTIITGSPGQKISIELKNESKSSTTHNFSLTDQGVDSDVQPGASTTVSVTIPQSGTVEFFCKFHRSSGMAGELSTS